jgi:redox-sensitive bicupin YhaK (pirin superfamily)
MKTKYYYAKDRGLTSTSWLKSYYSFNFNTMEEFDEIRFGQLRILNNDTILGGSGFGSHRHQNMEIITIPLAGGLQHKDSLGNSHEIIPGDVQVMTAGTGIVHSEYNLYKDQTTNFLQIWIFPEEENLEPRYDQRYFDPAGANAAWQRLIAPDHSAPLLIRQNAWLSRVSLDKSLPVNYNLNRPENGVLFYIISGKTTISGEEFSTGDAVGFDGSVTLELHATQQAEILAIEVPLTTSLYK